MMGISFVTLEIESGSENSKDKKIRGLDTKIIL